MEKTDERQRPYLEPEMSIVMPLYNSERTVGKTLNAIFENTFKNFEVIIVNDGSTDDSEQIAGNYPVRIFRQENSGQSKARNFGVSKAASGIIVFIDSDVIIPDFTLKRIYDAFASEKIEMVAGMPDSENHYKNRISDSHKKQPGIPLPENIHGKCRQRRSAEQNADNRCMQR